MEGLVSPFHHRTPRAIQVLRKHHSGSTLPQQVVDIRAAAMSWQCGHCHQMVKSTAQFCPQCGTARASYVAPTTAPWGKQAGGSQDWEWPDWQGWQEHSPRARRPTSPRSRQPWGKGAKGPKGKQKQGPKGPKGKPKEAMEREGPVAPKAAALPPPPAPATPSMPSSSTSNMAATLPSTEQTLLRALVAHVASQEGTPSELQQLLGQYQEDEHKATGKALHKLVTKQVEARKGLAKARQDRASFETAWSGYMSHLAQLLETQMRDRTEALQAFDQSEEAWKAQLEATTAELGRHTSRPESTDRRSPSMWTRRWTYRSKR